MRWILLLAVLAALSLPAPSLAADNPETLLHIARENERLIAVATANRNDQVGIVYLAGDAGRVDALLNRIGALGGQVGHVNRRIGYIRAVFPIAAAGRAIAVEDGDVAAVDVDPARDFPAARAGLPELPDPASWAQKIAEANSEASQRFLRSATPLLDDLGARQWRERHPTFDGRGVVIGHVEQIVDPMVPQLAQAFTLVGEPIRKIRRVHLAVDPGDHSGQRGAFDQAAQWLDVRATVRGDREVEYEGQRYRLPHPGTFQIGRFDLARIVGRPGWLAPAIGDAQFAVLWEKSTGRIWVDRDRNRDFSRARAMGAYNRTGDWSFFGAAEPAPLYPGVRPAISFMIVERPEENRLGFLLPLSDHAVGVAASMAGHPTFPGDPGQGVAPAAQIASFGFDPLKLHSQAEAAIAAAEDPDVDIVLYEQDSRAANLGFVGILLERLAGIFGKPVFVPGGNSVEIMAIHRVASGSNVVAVGGSQSADSFSHHHGFRPARRDHRTSGGTASGPALDGGLKPDLLAPSGYVTAVQSSARFGVTAMPDLYTLPPGYWLFSGTSQAGPTAAGAAALLLSAARQEGLAVESRDIVSAMRLGARQSTDLAAHEQGNGLIDVAASWEVLRRIAADRNVRPSAAGCRGSVRTQQWGRDFTGAVRGILETVGWAPGQRARRTLRFCLSRPIGMPRVSLPLNDGTFGVRDVRPVRGGAVEVELEIEPQVAGFHSTLVQIEDEQGRVVGRSMAGIAAAHRLAPENDYTADQEVLIPRPGYRPTFVEVPEGADALVVAAERALPFGLAIRHPSNDSQQYAPYRVRAQREGRSRYSITIPAPQAGVWEVMLSDQHDLINDTRSAIAVEPAPARLEFRAQFAPEEQAPQPGGEAEREVASLLASVQGTVAPAQPVLFELAVPANSNLITIDLSGSAAEVEGHLLECLRATCSVAHSLTGSSPSKRLAIPIPAGGRYVLALTMPVPGGANRPGNVAFRASVHAYRRAGN